MKTVDSKGMLVKRYFLVKVISVIAAVILVPLVWPADVIARSWSPQSNGLVEQQVTHLAFNRDGSEITIKGTLESPAGKTYSFSADAGQQLVLSLRSSLPIIVELSGATDWKVALNYTDLPAFLTIPESDQDYYLHIKPNEAYGVQLPFDFEFGAALRDIDDIGSGYHDASSHQVVSEQMLDISMPDDVFEEAMFWAGGGMHGSECSNDHTGSRPWIMGTRRFVRFQEFTSPIEVEWTEEISLEICGLSSDRLTDAVLVSEDGSTKSIDFWPTEVSPGLTSVFLSQYIPLFTPLGKYRVELRGADRKSVYSFDLNVVEAPTPRVYREGDLLFLTGFRPKEQVRIIAYNETELFTYAFSGWTKASTDSKGSLLVSVAPDSLDSLGGQNTVYLVDGKHAGQVFQLGPICYPTFYDYCTPFGSPAGVTIKQPTSNDLRSTTNIWNLVDYSDLQKPGKAIYQLTLQPDDRVRWGYSWCAVDKKTLERTAGAVEMEFFVNGQRVGPSVTSLFNQDFPINSNNGWACKRANVVLESWRPHSTIDLEVRLNITRTVSDGETTFRPGIYRYIIAVDVEK